MRRFKNTQTTTTTTSARSRPHIAQSKLFPTRRILRRPVRIIFIYIYTFGRLSGVRGPDQMQTN